ncbi:MAG: hypothetical protein KF687_05530 [Cyclobacteriaceae bacterium]|nr:hypothetical protein [Cyclobacteriaceae bacterium]
MLNRIIVLNSTTYGKAIVRLDDADSIQLVGPNNIGKSTLVFALNFLFIIDGKRMSFVDNKPGDKETIHHYFPSPTNSFIIFEIYKQRHYCILLKRNNEGEVEYYRIDHEYREELFIKTSENQQTVIKFEELYSKLVTSGITIEGFREKRDVFNFVYQRGRRTNAVVWLENAVTSDGLSNNFSKVYRYLINSKLITNKTLKEALIIADNRDKEALNFSQKSKKDINDLLRINDEIKVISSIQKDFFDFREVINLYKAKTIILSQLLFSFNDQYTANYLDNETTWIQKKNELEAVQVELNERLIPQKQTLDREIGSKEKELSQIVSTQKEIQDKIDEAVSFEGLDFLKQSLNNLDERRRALEASITRIQTLSVNEIEEQIKERGEQCKRLESQITGYSNQLIHRLSSNQTDKEKLNRILSSEFSSLPSELIEKHITSLETSMNLFNGKIRLPSNLLGKPIASIEDLSQKKALYKKELNEYIALLPIAKDYEKSVKELSELKTQISEVESKIGKIESLPTLRALLSKQKELYLSVSQSKSETESALSLLTEKINLKAASIPLLTNKIKDLDQRIKELKKWKEETEEIALDPIPNESTDTLNQIFAKLTVNKNDRSQLKFNKDKLFENLKQRVKSLESDEDAFVRFIEDEIACISDKQRSVETILQAISTQFANPAHLLVKRFEEFKEFINNKFNTKLSKTKISDIESLKIVLNESTRTIEDLKRISSIQEIAPQISFDFDHSINLKTLNNYLDSGKKIEFEELFDIELHLTKGGKEKRVDLKEQVESTGTDIMIRMVIITSVINKLAVNDIGNRVPIAIDEIARVDGKNRLELFKFCKEHNLTPLCTSTEETILDGFDKYIMLFRPTSKDKININEGSPNVMRQEPIDMQ